MVVSFWALLNPSGFAHVGLEEFADEGGALPAHQGLKGFHLRHDQVRAGDGRADLCRR